MIRENGICILLSDNSLRGTWERRRLFFLDFEKKKSSEIEKWCVTCHDTREFTYAHIIIEWRKTIEEVPESVLKIKKNVRVCWTLVLHLSRKALTVEDDTKCFLWDEAYLFIFFFKILDNNSISLSSLKHTVRSLPHAAT